MKSSKFKIDAVFFGDLGTTITTTDSIPDLYHDALVRVGIKSNIQGCRKALLIVNRWLYTRKHSGRFLNEREQLKYRNLLLSNMGVPKKRYLEFDELIQDINSNISYIPVLGIKNTLDYLNGERIPAVLIANWDSSILDILRKHGLEKRFQTTVISDKFGIGKPDLSIFEYTFVKLRKIRGKIRKTHTIMLGANLLTDIYPAEILKMFSVYFYPKKPLNPFSDNPGEKFRFKIVKNHKEFVKLVKHSTNT
ncbi:MAG: HAD family hydrolase [Candidatus Hodarchaeales archaeon]|jgi:FMN phosphatase YigB (HAD superfamily)